MWGKGSVSVAGMMYGNSSGVTMASRRSKKRKESTASADLYASKIIVGGALLDDTKTLLSHWDQEAERIVMVRVA